MILHVRIQVILIFYIYGTMETMTSMVKLEYLTHQGHLKV